MDQMCSIKKRELREWIPGLHVSDQTDMVPSMEMGEIWGGAGNSKTFPLNILFLRGPLGTSRGC